MEVSAPATHCRRGGGEGTVKLFSLLKKGKFYKVFGSLTENLKNLKNLKKFEGDDICSVIFSDKSNTFPEKAAVLSTKLSHHAVGWNCLSVCLLDAGDLCCPMVHKGNL